MELKKGIKVIESKLNQLKENECHIYDEDSHSEVRRKDMLFGEIVGMEKAIETLKSIEEQTPVNKYKIITLCGSTKFKEEFMKAQKELTLQGNIVISVGLFGHADGEYQTVLTDEVKVMLDDMHKRKIDLAEEIFVINKNGYVGSSTRSEIEYALKTGKKVVYLENETI